MFFNIFLIHLLVFVFPGVIFECAVCKGSINIDIRGNMTEILTGSIKFLIKTIDRETHFFLSPISSSKKLSHLFPASEFVFGSRSDVECATGWS